MMNRKNANIFWGFFFLAAAALVLLNQFIQFPFNIFQLLVAIFLVSIIVKSVPRRQFFGIFIPLALLVNMFSKSLFHISGRITVSLVVSAVFLSIGLTIFFKGRRVDEFNGSYSSFDNYGRADNTHNFSGDENRGYANTNNQAFHTGSEDNFANCSVNFSGKSHYLHAKSLERANLSCNFGELKVYFDQSQVSPQGAEINLDCSFGQIELYIPREWNVTNRLSSTLGSIEENYRPLQGTGPQVNLNGGVTLGTIRVFFV